jgi:hypothetical protein
MPFHSTTLRFRESPCKHVNSRDRADIWETVGRTMERDSGLIAKGHSSPKITLGVYAHLFSNNDERAAQAVNEALAKW